MDLTGHKAGKNSDLLCYLI